MVITIIIIAEFLFIDNSNLLDTPLTLNFELNMSKTKIYNVKLEYNMYIICLYGEVAFFLYRFHHFDRPK